MRHILNQKNKCDIFINEDNMFFDNLLLSLVRKITLNDTHFCNG